jgi:FtsP/CotA-like multicopper oxidase with cupredoxin domain
MTMQTRSRASSMHRALAVAVAGALALLGAQPGPAGAAVRPATARPGGAAHLALPAAPVGHLQPQGCTGTATVVCDLYAGTGTTTVAGQTIPIWGFSGSVGTATLPGPQLVVKQGSTVQLRLHNNLTGERVSLAVPGIANLTWGTRHDDDTAGVAAGSTRVYTFTATAPGTFLYEAGHTANGARQVAMGLAGALVVLPDDGTAYGTRAGYPSTAYDDEAVLVLSEIDPKLNADPAAFDMRSFSPRFRLINGKAFPETDAISTDQGHRVLLRYVNAGAQLHAMSALGAEQVEVAQDGHPMQYASTVVAEDVVPGQTLDTIVTAPTGAESKIALYEAAGRLSNDGQHAADPLRLAFGGMLTYLDTNAPPPSTDGVGPLADNISLSPQPASGLVDVTVRADLSDATTGGSSVMQAEFVVDDTSTAPGAGTPMFGPFGSVDVAGAVGTLSVAAMQAIEAGKHVVFVRALDSAGNWGVVGSAVLNLPKVGPQTTSGSASPNPTNGADGVDITATGDDRTLGGTIDRAEYSIDVEAAPGAGTPMTLNKVAPLVSETATIPAATLGSLGDGTHVVYVRSHDSAGLWGPTHSIELVIDLAGPVVDAASVGPNPTNAILSDKGNPGFLLVSAHVVDQPGTGGSVSKLVDAEAFLDLAAGATPAGGSGLQLIAVDASMDSSDEAVYGLLPLSQVRALPNGTHRMYVRALDAAGTWGDFSVVTLLVDKTAPVLAGLSASPNPTAGASQVTLTTTVTEANTLAAAEYWVGTTDPGAGRATSASVSTAGTQLTVDVPTANLPPGAQRINLRVKDLAGNWSNAVATTVTIEPPNAIFSDGFESGSIAAWSSSVGTGGLAVTGAAALEGTNGLAVTQPSGGTARYLVDATPNAEQTYHARFRFSGNTWAGGVTALLQGVSSTNAPVLAVEMRNSGGTYQVRGVLRRSTGTNVTGTWVPLTAGAHTLRVDWAAGNAGTLQLSVDGIAKQLLTAANATLRVDTARLGAVTVASTSHGTAYLDSFESTRRTLP